MAAVEVPQTLEYRGGQLNAAPVLDVENFTNWKKRFMCHIIGIEPQLENIISNGLFVPMAAGQRKPEAQWTADTRKAANLDQRLKSLIINTNHVNDSELASLFGKLKYEENLIDSIYETEKNKSLGSATPLSTAFFSTSIVQDFKDSPDDEEDTRSSHEYVNDLEEEYQAKVLLAKSKRFFKKGTQRFNSAKATDQTECHKCGKKGHFARDCWSKISVPSYQSSFQPKLLLSSENKPETRNTKDFEAKYNKVKAKLALLSSNASTPSSFSSKNKGLIIESYDWDEEEVSSDDKETEVKALMAHTDEERISVGKESARNGEWTKITIKKVHTLLEMEDNDDRKSFLDYLCIGLNYVEEQRNNLSSKHRNLVQELNACKEQLLVLKQAKLDLLTMQHVNTKILKENQNLRLELKELTSITETWLNSSNKVNQFINKKIPTEKKKILGIGQLTKDTSSCGSKDLVFVKSSADNSDMSITSSNLHKSSEAEDSTLPNHDTDEVPSNKSQRNTTDPSAVVSDSPASDYDSADESSVCSTPLLPLKKLDGAEPGSGPKTVKSILKSKSTFKAETLKGITLNEPSSAPARGNKSSSASKTNSAPAGKLKNVKVEDDPPLAMVMKELNELKLQISKKKSSYSRNKNTQQVPLNALQNKYKTQFKMNCELCGQNNHLSENCYEVLFCKKCKRTNHRTCDHAEFMSSIHTNQHHAGQGLFLKEEESILEILNMKRETPHAKKAESSNALRSKTLTKRSDTQDSLIFVNEIKQILRNPTLLLLRELSELSTNMDIKSGIYGEVGLNIFRNAIGAHYLPHSSEYVAPPSIDVVRKWFPMIGYGEEVSTKGTPRKILLPPTWRLLMAHIIQCLGDKTGAKPGAKTGHKKPATSSKQPTSSKTIYSKRRKESSSTMDSNLSRPSISTPMDTEMHKEDQQVTSSLTSLGVTSEERAHPQLSSGMSALNLNKPIFSASFIIHSESASGHDVSADFIAEADPKLSAPNDSIPPQQGLETVLTQPTTKKEASSTAIHGDKEEASTAIHDDPVIIVDESDEDEPNAETKDTSVPISSSPSSLPTELKDLPSKFNELTEEIKRLKTQTLQLELPEEFLSLLAKVESAQAKLKTLDALPSLLLNVTKALNKFAEVLKSTSTKARDQSIPSAGQADTMPAEGEKDTNQATISQLFQKRAKKIDKGKNIISSKEAEKESTKSDSDDEAHVTGSMVTSSKVKKLKKFDFVTEDGRHVHLSKEQINNQKKLEEEAKAEVAKQEGEVRKSELIDLLGLEVVHKKGPITFKVYREDGTYEVIPNFKVSDLHLGEWREVIKACPDRKGKGWQTIYDQIQTRMDYLHTTEAELGINLDIPLSMQDPLDKLNDLANKKRKHADDIHDYFKATKRLKSSVQYGDHLPGTVLNEPVLGPKVDDHARTFSSLLLAEVDKRNLNPLKQIRTIKQLRQFQGTNILDSQFKETLGSRLHLFKDGGLIVSSGISSKSVVKAIKAGLPAYC
ncbi:retrovirus-related pol polyprotein from transposon TNT 1-94 [Tanacetum coccineum]